MLRVFASMASRIQAGAEPARSTNFVSEECVVEPYQEGGKSRQRLDTVGRAQVRTKHVTDNGPVA